MADAAASELKYRKAVAAEQDAKSRIVNARSPAEKAQLQHEYNQMHLATGSAYNEWHSSVATGSTGATPVAAGITPAPAPATDPSRQGATALAQGILQSWGMPTSLTDSLTGYIQQGITDSTSLSILLQQTPEYQQRFPANKLRQQQGLSPLSPAEYVSVENSYRQIMASAGLPKGFYDTNDDFSNLIANDMSPSELQGRVQDAQTLLTQTQPWARQAAYQEYGIDDGHLIAHFLDPNAAAPILQKQVQVALAGGAELAQGLALTNKQKLEGYVDNGLTQAQAQRGAQQIASVLPDESAIAQRFGKQYGQSDAEDEFLGGLASAARSRRDLNQQETNLFRGGTGMATTAYGGANRAAELGGSQEGSY